jgi:hypothetical protein
LPPVLPAGLALTAIAVTVGITIGIGIPVCVVVRIGICVRVGIGVRIVVVNTDGDVNILTHYEHRNQHSEDGRENKTLHSISPRKTLNSRATENLPNLRTTMIVPIL